MIVRESCMCLRDPSVCGFFRVVGMVAFLVSVLWVLHSSLFEEFARFRYCCGRVSSSFVSLGLYVRGWVEP